MKRAAIPVNGPRIAELRNAAGLTQAELAAKIGYEWKSISRAENSHGGAYLLLAAIASEFGVKVDDLIRNEVAA